MTAITEPLALKKKSIQRFHSMVKYLYMNLSFKYIHYSPTKLQKNEEICKT